MTAPLTPSLGAPFARLLSVAGARGSRVVTNDEMCTMIDSTPEWIEQRTGIVERRWVGEGQSALSLAVDAGRLALERASLDPASVDAVLCATISHQQQTPALACLVAASLGCPAPVAFDISAACAGFNHAVALAESMVRAGSARQVLVIGVEALSELTDHTDRSTAFIFSDGAGAVVVGPSEVPALGPVVWGSDPSASSVIEMPDWRDARAAGEGPYITMEGRAVFKWATTFIAQKTTECLLAAGLTPEQLDVFIPHQANNRITDAMLRQLKLPEGVVVARDIVGQGNSSAASVPLAMDALLQSGEARSGQTALTIGFGAGLVFAGQVLTLP